MIVAGHVPLLQPRATHRDGTARTVNPPVAGNLGTAQEFPLEKRPLSGWCSRRQLTRVEMERFRIGEVRAFAMPGQLYRKAPIPS
jgi:hypothetical protein